jgi:hypothetical protein
MSKKNLKIIFENKLSFASRYEKFKLKIPKKKNWDHFNLFFFNI